jgi:hypothetical protein
LARRLRGIQKAIGNFESDFKTKLAISLKASQLADVEDLYRGIDVSIQLAEPIAKILEKEVWVVWVPGFITPLHQFQALPVTPGKLPADEWYYLTVESLALKADEFRRRIEALIGELRGAGLTRNFNIPAAMLIRFRMGSDPLTRLVEEGRG